MNPLKAELERRLQLVLGLSPERAARLLDEVLDGLSYEVDEYVLARHATLRAEGLSNKQIYDRIAGEVAELRFKVSGLTARQIRRRIYG